MSLIIEQQDLEKFIMIGDRVLIRPKNQQGKPLQDYTCHLPFRKTRKHKADIS